MRIESVLDQIERQGFENFDSLIALYYDKTFIGSSSLTSEQWLSRNCRLPHLIAGIFASSRQWNQLERRCLNDEIFLITEGLLNAEISAARDDIPPQMLVDLDAHREGGCEPINMCNVLAVRDDLMNKVRDSTLFVAQFLNFYAVPTLVDLTYELDVYKSLPAAEESRECCSCC